MQSTDFEYSCSLLLPGLLLVPAYEISSTPLICMYCKPGVEFRSMHTKQCQLCTPAVLWLVTLKAHWFHVLGIVTLIVPLRSKLWRFPSATTNSWNPVNSVTLVPSTPLLHHAAVILPVCYSMAIMWILRAEPSAVSVLWQDWRSATTIWTRTVTWRPAKIDNKMLMIQTLYGR